MDKKMKATFIKEIQGTAPGVVQRLYECEEGGPLPRHVVVSASTRVPGGETYIFASDANGTITDWCELEGSYKGGLNHEDALRFAGYETATSG